MLRGLQVSLLVAGGAGLSWCIGLNALNIYVAASGSARPRRRVVHRASLLRPVAQLGAPDALDEAGLRRATPAPRVRSARTRLAVRSIGDAR